MPLGLLCITSSFRENFASLFFTCLSSSFKIIKQHIGIKSLLRCLQYCSDLINTNQHKCVLSLKNFDCIKTNKFKNNRDPAESLGSDGRHQVPRVCLMGPGRHNWQWRDIIGAQMICYYNISINLTFPDCLPMKIFSKLSRLPISVANRKQDVIQYKGWSPDWYYDVPWCQRESEAIATAAIRNTGGAVDLIRQRDIWDCSFDA